MNAPLADERAMLARTRPNAFDQLRDTGKLGVGMLTGLVDVKALAGRRWAAGEALRRLHAAGWQNPCGGAANPLSGAEAAAARARFAEIEAIVGEGLWPVVVRVVIVGDSLRQCHDLLAASLKYVVETILLDRLCLALDRMAPLLANPST